jgi:hypothetical protein
LSVSAVSWHGAFRAAEGDAGRKRCTTGAAAVALRRIIDDSFVGSTPDNQIINKESLFPPSGSEPMFTNAHFVSLSAKIIGNTAVVFGNMITTGDPTALRCAMVYAKRAGTWKMIAAQLVPSV